MMFRRDQAMIPNVLIRGREWNVHVTPRVRTVPTNGAEVPAHYALAAEAWFVKNQVLFDLEGLTLS